MLGPVARGWLTDRLSWQWVLAANLPLAATALAVIRVRLRLGLLPVPGRDRPSGENGSPAGYNRFRVRRSPLPGRRFSALTHP